MIYLTVFTSNPFFKIPRQIIFYSKHIFNKPRIGILHSIMVYNELNFIRVKSVVKILMNYTKYKIYAYN